MAATHNPFDEAYIRANFSYPQLPGANSADASIAANASSTSLVDPMLEKEEARSTPHSPARQQSIEDIAQASIHHGKAFPAYEARQPGYKPMKTVAPIRVPRRSEPGAGTAQDNLRSPATALSSAALTSSFPLPPPRTPASGSGTFGSPSHSGHGHSNPASTQSAAGTGSNSPHDHSQRQSPTREMHFTMPRKMLSVPPPTPTFSNSRSSTSLGLYWEGEASSVRNSGSHPLPSGILPYYSPDPAAHPLSVFQQEANERHLSYAAEISTPVRSIPASPSYPPRAYSPAGSSDVSRSDRLLRSPHSTNEGNVNYSPGGRPYLQRTTSERSEEREYYGRRRESSGTFGTVFSNAPSTGMNHAINPLEQEDFASTGTRTTSHTRANSEVSMVSSAGMTHELVRRGNVFEARPSSAGLQETSRRLARASLVSSELLRSASSTDALRSVLAEDPTYAVDADYSSRPPTRMRQSHRYSSGPAPTLASLAEDEDDHDLPPADLDYMHSVHKSRHRSTGKRPGGGPSRRNSDWGNKSTKSYLSHKSGKSSAHFTVASRAPSLPTLHKPSKRAEIAAREGTIPFKKLAKRASTLGDILDNMPEHDPYISHSSEGCRDPSYDELSELRYSNQLRKARRKIEVGLPGIWQSRTPMGSVSTGNQEREESPGDMREIYPSNGSYYVHPGAELDDRHFRRRKSYPASQMQEIMSSHSEKTGSSVLHGRSSFSSSGSHDEEPEQPPQKPPSWWRTLSPQKKRKVRLAVILLLGLIIAAAVGAAIPLSKKSGGAVADDCTRSCSSQGKAVLKDGQCTCECSGNRSGPFCDLDTTCACPDGSDTCQYRLAKSLISTANYASTLFAPPVNTSRLASSLAQLNGGNTEDCAGQTVIIETANLDPAQYKARRRWSQAVLLWDAATSEDFTSNSLKNFQNSLSYWQWQDSPSFQAQPTFQTETHGYSIDFAYQRVFVEPKTLSELGISPDVSSRLDNSSSTALQKVGAFALAASAQRTTALSHLFQQVGSDDRQLAAFREAVQAAPVYFPFDITRSLRSQSMLSVALSQRDGGSAFPLPSACYPGLSASQLTELNKVEADIFGLPVASSEAEARMNCTERPTYGFLNILNLRLPFLDGQRAFQAAAISNRDRKSRVTFSAGQSLTPLLYSGAVNSTSISTASFGSVAGLDNVLFDFLIQLGDGALIKALIDYVSSGGSAPPTPTSTLWTLSNGLQSLPVLEAQLWGTLQFSDVDYIVSGISETGGNTLFGSDRGAQLRSWAHSNSNSKPIRWSLEATSSQYALDSGSSNAFQGAWDSSRTSSPADIYNNLGSSNLLTS